MSLYSSLRLVPGSTVLRQNQRYKIVKLVSADEVIAESEDGQWDKYHVSEFLPALSQDQDNADILKLTDKEWARATGIYETIKPLIELGEQRTRADVVRVASEVGKNVATLYRWLKAYESTGLVSSLARTQRSDIGKTRLVPDIEAIIDETIEIYYLTEQRRSPSKIADEVEKRCKQKGLVPPSRETVRKRIFSISEEERIRKREGKKAAKDKFEPIKGKFPGADFPLAVVQIDHTPMDVIIVDDITREPIGRPFLTIAIDVFSKMCMGFYITMEHPSALSTGICIANAILGKEIYLTRLGLDHLSWSCWGVMRTIHTDNAKEFKGTMLGRAAEDYGMIAELRPKGSPHYGGHVERAFRTYMKEVHNELPGTTFSNVQEKQDYDAEGSAVMTMDALEKWFTTYIVGVYHQKAHKGNDNLSPVAKWELGIFGDSNVIGTGIPIRVPDEDKLRLDFMPYIERTIQEYGIRFEGIEYWCDALRHLIHSKEPGKANLKRKYICRYDPRDLSHIWLFDSDSGQYVDVPYRDISRPAISLWELTAAKKHLKSLSYASVNEELIFQSIDEMREIVDKEVQKTKSARKQKQRRKQWTSSPNVVKPKAQPKSEVSKNVDTNDDFDDIDPFEGIRESD